MKLTKENLLAKIKKLQRVCDCAKKIDFDIIEEWYLAHKKYGCSYGYDPNQNTFQKQYGTGY